MPIKRVEGFNSEARVQRLNGLVDAYNKLSPNPRKASPEDRMNLLQRIDGEARRIFEAYIADKPSADSDKFYLWFKTDPLLGEFKAFYENSPLSVNNQRLFELSSPPIATNNFGMLVLDLQACVKANKKGKIDIRSIEENLMAAQMYEQRAREDPNNRTLQQRYAQNIRLLQDNIINVRNGLNPKQNKKLCKALDKMLRDVNSHAAFITNNAVLEADFKRHKGPISEITQLLEDEQQETLIHLLNSAKDEMGNKKEIMLGNYKLRGLGGKNNQNWLANDITFADDKACIVRLEKFEATSFKGMDRERLYRRQEMGANQHIENNFETVPLGVVYTGGANRDQPVHYVLAISEFCQGGDLLSIVHNLPGNAEDKLDSILDMVTELCDLHQELLEQGYVYTDLKAENFLLRNGKIRNEKTVISSDLKSVTPLESDGMLQAYNAQAKAIHPMTIQPSQKIIEEAVFDDAGKVNPELITSYLMAVVLNVLVSANVEKYPTGTHERHLAGQFQFDLTDPIFSTPKGEKLKELIEKIRHSNKNNVVSLETIKNEIRNIKTMDLRHSAQHFRQDMADMRNSAREERVLEADEIEPAEIEPSEEADLDEPNVRHSSH